jgi:hypothetical protein
MSACRAIDDTVADCMVGVLIQHFETICNCSNFTDETLDISVPKSQKNLIFVRNYQFIGRGGDL